MLMLTEPTLSGSNLLLAPERQGVTAKAGGATVRIAGGAVCVVVNNEGDVSVLCLHERTTGDVIVRIGGQDIELRAGEQVIVTGSRALNFADVNPIPGVACRDIKEHTLAGGQRAFLCQFSIASAMENLRTIRQLSRSQESRDRAIHAKILKNAAILHMVTARKGPYKTWHKTHVTARAI